MRDTVSNLGISLEEFYANTTYKADMEFSDIGYPIRYLGSMTVRM
jgi:hypothetical protein